MGKGDKKTSKGKRAKKTDVKDLTVKSPSGVKGGKVSMQDFHFVSRVNTASTNFFSA